MSPESARPEAAGASMPGFHFSRLRARGGVALGEGLDDTEDVLHLVVAGVAELAHRLVQGRRERSPQRLVRSRLEPCPCPTSREQPLTATH